MLFCSLSTRRIEKHVRAVKKTNQCQECHYVTWKSSRVNRDILDVHRRIRSIDCYECDYSAIHKRDHEFHFRWAYTVPKVYKCPKCEYQDNQITNFSMHIKTKHIQIKDYNCDEFPYTAFQKDTMVRLINVVDKRNN